MNKKIICTITNGYAEEMIATQLMDAIDLELKKLQVHNEYQFIAGALVSSGKKFQEAKYPTFFIGNVSPSGGFPTHSLSAFFLDLEAGVFLNPFKMSHLIKKWTQYHLELILVVGDTFLMMTALGALKKKNVPLVFIPTAKSDYIQTHYTIEKKLIKKYAVVTFPRDRKTVHDFRRSQINVLDCGNLIQDLVNRDAKIILSQKPIVALLPGSRHEAYGNLEMLLEIVDQISHLVDWSLVCADSLDFQKISEIFMFYQWSCKNLEDPIRVWKKDNKIIYHYTESMFDSVALSCQFAISLAGTASEQIVGLGKPVIGFKGTGPQSSHARMLNNQKLLGDAFIYLMKKEQVASETLRLLLDEDIRRQLGDSGAVRMGNPGATKCVASHIVQYIIQNPAR